jgi:lathosterol oxidase
MDVLLEFLAIFSFILIPGYIAPAGFYYWAYHVRNFKDKELLRIQPRHPKPDQIGREVKLSMISILIFSVMATGVLQLYLQGHTNIYLWARDYPVYSILSVPLCLALHDTYFYWTHRFMHWQPVFKYIHLGHHKSITPTPWPFCSLIRR